MSTRQKIIYILIPFLIGCAGTAPEGWQKFDAGGFEVPNTQKNKLFVKSMEWMSLTWHSPNFIIQYSDKEEGEIIYKATIYPDSFKYEVPIISFITLDSNFCKVLFYYRMPIFYFFSYNIESVKKSIREDCFSIMKDLYFYLNKRKWEF